MSCLTSNMEDYLEAIYRLSRPHGFARVKDIAAELNVASSSVNSALKVLTQNELVQHERYGQARLTRKGIKIASGVQNRHDLLYQLMTRVLLLDSELSEKEACAIEHAISQTTYRRLIELAQFLESDKKIQSSKLLASFKRFLQNREESDDSQH